MERCATSRIGAMTNTSTQMIADHNHEYTMHMTTNMSKNKYKKKMDKCTTGERPSSFKTMLNYHKPIIIKVRLNTIGVQIFNPFQFYVMRFPLSSSSLLAL